MSILFEYIAEEHVTREFYYKLQEIFGIHQKQQDFIKKHLWRRKTSFVKSEKELVVNLFKKLRGEKVGNSILTTLKSAPKDKRVDIIETSFKIIKQTSISLEKSPDLAKALANKDEAEKVDSKEFSYKYEAAKRAFSL